MKPKKCPVCSFYLNEDAVEYWCDMCDHSEFKEITHPWEDNEWL